MIITYLILGIITVYMLAPLWFLVTNSFKDQSQIIRDPLGLPPTLSFSYILNAIGEIHFFRSLGITFSITFVSVALIVLISSIGAWILARNHTWWSNVIFMSFVAAMLIPFQAIMYPLIQFFDTMTLKNVGGLILMYGGFGLSMSIFLYHGFVKGVPKGIEEAGIIDGCNILQLFFHVVLPLLSSITVTVIVLNSMWIWNDYLLPFLVIGNSPTKTLVLELYFARILAGQYGNPWQLIFPAVLVTIIPIVIIFLFLQRYIVQGITEGDPSRISDKACTIIRKVAEELGYYPDPLARNFSLQRHRSIGFLLPQDINFSLGNPYLMELIQGIGSVCQKYGNTLTLIPPLNESIAEAVRCAAVDGLITHAMSADMGIVQVIRQRKIPFVTIDGIASVDMPSVNIDDGEASYSIMRMVLEAGHRDIAIIGLSEVSYEKNVPKSIQHVRYQGYLKALQEFGLDRDSPCLYTYTCECTIEEGRRIGHRIADLEKHPTCVVSMSDIIAIGCMLYFAEHDIVVPKDISVVGFDNIQESALIVPSLTTVDQPAGEKGRQAAEMLFTMINGQAPPSIHIHIPYRIVTRDSLVSVG